MRRLTLALAFAAAASPAGGQPPADDVFKLVEAMDAAAAREAWPGFRLTDWPLAVYDGTRTLLLRHPSAPSEFAPLSGHPGVLVADGQYPGVGRNSTADIGGVRTATIVAGPGFGPQSALLAYVEELFHVFWLSRHSKFRPNEMARYLYPVKDVRNSQWVLAEHEALARALDGRDGSEVAAWAARALQIRRERSLLLNPDHRAFETGLEMMEGTANYVARTVAGLGPAETARRLRDPRAADQIRWRYYDSGTALCLLLDRFEPDWKRRIDGDAELTTAVLLERALAGLRFRPASFSTAERDGFASRAVEGIAELSARQARVRQEVLGRDGFQVVVEAGGEPFRVSRFDPIELLVLEEGEVAHPHYLALSDSGGTIELRNPSYARGSFAGVVGISSAAGRHPLVDGVRGLRVTGLDSAPRIERQEGKLIVEAEGVRIVLGEADLRTEGRTLHIVSNGASKQTLGRSVPGPR